MDENLRSLLSSRISPEDKEELLHSHIKSNTMPIITAILSELPQIWSDLSLSRLTKLIKNILSTLPSNQEHLNLVDSLILAFSNKKLLSLDLQAHRIELLLFTENYSAALASIDDLAKELKRHNDKVNLIRLMVCESRAYCALKNEPRAKSALVSARALAVSTFCPPFLQANIDLLSGMYLCDEKNSETSFAYFLESLDGFVLENCVEALIVSRYLVLCKIVGGKYGDVFPLITRLDEKVCRVASVSNDRVIGLLLEVSKCCIDRNLTHYSELLTDEKIQDSFIESHLHLLYERLLEANILKIVEPYTNIKIEYVSKNLRLDENVVEGRLRKMILDGKISGILDHVGRCLLLHTKIKADQTKNEILDNMIKFVSGMKKKIK